MFYVRQTTPLCCRIFPLDLFSRNSKPEWGVYTYCPPENVKPIIFKNGKPEIDLEVILICSDLIEKNLPQGVLDYLIHEDIVTSQIERLDDHRDDFIILTKLIKN